MKKAVILLFWCCMAIALHAQDSVMYDFNSLIVGNLNNQDNWKTIQQVNGTADFQVDMVAGSTASFDGTYAVFYNAGGPGVGRTATRKATPNFNFNFQTGGVQEVEFQLYRSYWGVFFGVGFDADGDGIIAPGLATEPNDGGFMINIEAKDSSTSNKIILPDGTNIPFTAVTNGWAWYKMVLDFTANSGEGAMALFIKPACQGPWMAVPQIQGINMHLTPGSGNKRDNQVWDGIFFHSEGALGGLDNIKIRLPNTGGLLFQFIDFPAISNKLTTDPPFALSATASSLLPVQYTVVSGPATVQGNTVTLSGTAGMVTITANQPGDTVFGPAPEVQNTFEVIDATVYQADLVVRRPADGTKVFMATLDPILLVASAEVLHPEVLGIQQLNFVIDGVTIPGNNWGTGYYTAQWTPTAFGNFSMTVNATITGGNITSQTVNFEVTSAVTDQQVQAYDAVWFKPGNTVVTGNFTFPTYVGSFNLVKALLSLTCPVGGCETYDRITSLEVKSPTGHWIELMRYITPYGKGCDHQLDVTDYSSLLQGKVEMRFTWGLLENGYIASLDFDLTAGEPAFKYSWVDEFWHETYPFGDYANLQPVPEINWNFRPSTAAAKLKIVNTGHGWGSLNTGNAAEFFNATHYLKVNNTIAFTQNLYVTCNPNPDGCQPQNGTWYYNRAGWCPGSIGHVYDYDFSSFINQGNIDIRYVFDTTYIDYCHPNNPNCVTGLTCANCNDPDNPRYIVAGNFISFSNDPLIGINEPTRLRFSMIPNPAHDQVRIEAAESQGFQSSIVEIINAYGQVQQRFPWKGETKVIYLSSYTPGIYFLKIKTTTQTEVRKLIIQ